jgi:uncharacterized protein (TIGR04222 family)
VGDVSNDLSVGVFLMEFGAALVLIIALAAIWREWIRRAGDAGDSHRLLDQYERIWLRFGRTAAIERAVLNLLRTGNLSLDRNELQRVHLQDFEGVSHPLEIDVMDTVARYGSLQIGQIPYAVITEATRYTLAQAGLIPQRGKRWLSVIPAVVVVPAIVLVGALETTELLMAAKPVALVVLMTVAGAFAVARLCLPAHRTRRGDLVVKHLQATTPVRDTTNALVAIRVERQAA